MYNTKLFYLLLFISIFYSSTKISTFANSNFHEVYDESRLEQSGFLDAYEFGFSSLSSGVENTKALQKALDKGGTVVVSRPGTYNIAGTIYIGSNTSLIFGNDIYLKKVDEEGSFTHVILNKGALTKTYDENILVEGLHIIVNGIDKAMTEVFGLRGHIAFFYVKDLRIERFRCLDLKEAQFCIHVCTFEDLIINDVIIKGKKDGIHLGRGKRFTISNGVFQTFDDAIALNAHDYATSNPELGWIENGIVEKCWDLDAENTTGFFCRILAGAWIDWEKGMEVQHSDAVVANGRIYRVQAKADGTIYKSVTQPTHLSGSQVVDGINWGVVQEDITYTAGVRNVVFRDIFLEKPRVSFSIHFDNDRYSRSYYPGAEIPKQEQLLFDNVQVVHSGSVPFLGISTPVDVINIRNCSFGNNGISVNSNKAMDNYLKTYININGCVFRHDGIFEILRNRAKGKEIFLRTSSSIVLQDGFSALVDSGDGKIVIESDLPGLTE